MDERQILAGLGRVEGALERLSTRVGRLEAAVAGDRTAAALGRLEAAVGSLEAPDAATRLEAATEALGERLDGIADLRRRLATLEALVLERTTAVRA